MTETSNRNRSNENDVFNLLPPSLEESLTSIYSTEKLPTKKETVYAYAKFFTPNSNRTWFVLEGSWNEDKTNFIFFGLVHVLEREYVYFSLNELENVGRKNFLYGIERDLYFKPTLLSDIIGNK